MLTILINAYACSPNMGSEPGMAWNWCVYLAKYCELHIITEGEFREKIEKALPALPQGKNMHFYYNPVPAKVRQLCWNRGDWRFYFFYKKWQKKTLTIAQKIVAEHPIDILHQLNMIGFREPGYLWKIKGIPFVWGPVDAKEKFPVAYLQGTGFKTELFVHLKNFLTALQLRHVKRLRQALSRASIVVSTSSNSQETFHKFFNVESPLINETGCYIQEYPVLERLDRSKFDVLWVGKLDFRKQLGLAIQAIAKSNNQAIRLHIVGGGDDSSYKVLAASLNISDHCIFHGAVTHQQVQRLMQESDLFFFTSLAEGTPHVVLEAIANNLPVLCFDTCGQGDSVNDKVGRKVNLTNPKQSIADFAEQLNALFNNRELLKELSLNCKQRQQELSWDEKAQKMVELYKECIC